jgi:hypothetical protein
MLYAHILRDKEPPKKKEKKKVFKPIIEREPEFAF